MHYDTVFLDMGFTLVDIARRPSKRERAADIARRPSGRKRAADIVPSMEAILARAIHDVGGQDVSLADLGAAMREVWSEVLDDEPMVWEEPSEETDRQWIRDIDRRIFARVGIVEQADAIADRAYDLFSQPDTYRVYDDVWPALETLRARGCRLGIVSNWGWHLPAICEGLGLAPHFDGIFASARVGFEKPHPGLFRHALTTMKSDPARTVHVGDSLRTDVRGAQAAGLDAVLLVRDARSVPEEPGCPVIHNLLDLLGILERGA